MSIFNVGPANPVPSGTNNMFDAAVRWPNNKYYFFKGTQWASYDMATKTVDPGFPRAISQGFPDLASNFGSVDSAVILVKGTAVSPLFDLCFFFKGNQSIVYAATGDYGDFVTGPIAANVSTSTEFSALAPRNQPSQAVQILADDCRDDNSAFLTWGSLNPAWKAIPQGPFTCAELYLSSCQGTDDYTATVRRLCPASCARLGYADQLCPPSDKTADHIACPTFQTWLPSALLPRACENPFINRMCPATCAGKAVLSTWCKSEGAYAACVASYNVQKSPFPAACPTDWYSLGQLGFWNCPSVLTQLLGNVSNAGVGAFSTDNKVATRLWDENAFSFFQYNNSQQFALAIYTSTGSSRFVIPQYALTSVYATQSLALQGSVYADGKLVSDAVQSHISASASIPTSTLAASYFAFAETTMWPVQLVSSGSPAVLSHNLVSSSQLLAALSTEFNFVPNPGVVYDVNTNWPRMVDVFPGLKAFCQPRGSFIAYAMQVCFSNQCKDTSGANRAFVLSFVSKTADTQQVQINLFRSNGALIYTTTTTISVEVNGTVTIRLKDDTEMCDDLVTQANGVVMLVAAGYEKSPAERNYRFQRTEKKLAQWAWANADI